MMALCKSCTQIVNGAHSCPGFKVSTAAAAAAATVSAPGATSTFPALVVCTCGVTYRYGAAHSCVLNGTFFTTPATDPRSLEIEERNARSLQRIAGALEKLVRVFLPQE